MLHNLEPLVMLLGMFLFTITDYYIGTVQEFGLGNLEYKETIYTM